MASLSSSNARLASARRLTRRKDRRETGRFLAEGVQAVREALAAGVVEELFVTAAARERWADVLAAAPGPIDEISPRDAANLSETVSPQGLVAVCRSAEVTIGELLARRPTLLIGLVEPNDPGNLGTIIRTADAAGADGVLLDGGADLYNGKVVRATAGSLFHLPVVSADLAGLLAGPERAGLTTLATTATGRRGLDELAADGSLAAPSLWLFGNEANGLPEAMVAAADDSVRIPMYGPAESLNLSVAAALCLYASAAAQHRPALG